MPYRERLPSFITDVFDDTVARRGLLVGSVVLVAAAPIAGTVALLVLGQRDPLSTVWEYTDERVVAPAD